MSNGKSWTGITPDGEVGINEGGKWQPQRTLGGSIVNSSTYRLTFHIQHPTIPASEIEASLSFPTRISQSSGARRKTKSGKILEGTYACTSIIFLLHRTPLKFEETP